jgi:hypothetical protein
VNITQAAAQSGGGETKTYTVTYKVTSKNTLTVSGTSPSGSSATLAETYSTSMQMTSGNSQTYTLSGYDGCTIKGITMSMKSNSKGGAGTLSVTSGSKTIASIGNSAFNTSNWYGSWSTSYVNVSPQVTPQVVGSGEKIVVKISATANSLYCQSITITYESTENGSETPDPNPEPETNTYTKYTGELVEGDYIVVYSDKAMKATVSSNRLSYDTVTPSNNVISNPDEAIVWHISKNGSYWIIYNASVNKYAASNGTKNQAQLLASGTDDKSLWTVSGTTTYEFVNKYNKSRNVNANLRNNGTYGFACYATSTGGALTLYKKN